MDTNVPAGARKILELIGNTEAPRGYDTCYGNNQAKILPLRVTTMTLDRVMAEQRNWTKRFGSSACGRYQFMRDTLRGLKSELKLSGSELLDSAMQDRLGLVLLRRRGLDAFLAGKLSATAFGFKLAQEWASFPVLAPVQGAHRKVARGQSYYAGDGLNKSLLKPATVEAVLAAARAAPAAPAPVAPKVEPPAAAPAPATAPAAPAGFLARFADALRRFRK